MPILKILHLEDNPTDAELMLRTIEESGIMCDVVRVETESDYRAAIERKGFDLIVSDFSLPGFDGKSALRIARQQAPEIPFIFVSGTIGEEAAIESLVAGATDYVLKNQFSRLAPAIRRAQRESEEKKERKRVEGQLLRAQRLESIGTLAGGIAHDLNNVLAPILMAVQLLKERNVNPSTENLLEVLEQSALRGANIVRQVLTFARGAHGERVTLQPKHLLSSMERMLMETFPKSIRIESDMPAGLWTVTGDPTQLDQLLLNLCVNARDAMPDGGVLTIRAENIVLDEYYARLNVDASTGSYVMLEIVDTGHGIPPEVIDKIFEPFFTTKEVGKGTGLGLSTSIAIVKSHAGFINVYSEPGQGTSFKVYLPAKKSAEAETSMGRRQNLPMGNGETILIVDDEFAVREVAQMILQSYGYRVLSARNGVEALNCYTRNADEIALVLIDVMMPVMDGPTTINGLRAIDPDVRIIAASGLIENAKQLSVFAEDGSPICAVLAKPYTAEKLLVTIHQVLHPL